ncbi:hypothetical protein Q5H93_02525 [Hymenobacter sp. ASUV-10]|uniref:DUF4230 domain-containing protein n=1 Tax=Hymenobacter aranciens TaxID=3063996 RepID=A0ABT9B5P6_9BACT|nr:hypothetical protein [Hymenobacter sp. ASUV-10]MDO7873592.1 hypothetical protein [Hymenobacter sp. ASUV-10]
MEAPPVSVRAKRGCLWYLGVAIAGAFGLLALLIAAYIFSPDEPGQHSIVVSADDQTYLEAETTNHGEGFLDGYDWLEIYYVRRGWFGNKRVQVYNFPHQSSYGIGFRRRIDSNGLIRIEIKRPGNNAQIHMDVYQELFRKMQLAHRHEAWPPDKSVLQALQDSVNAKVAALEKVTPIDSVMVAVFIPPATFPEK